MSRPVLPFAAGLLLCVAAALLGAAGSPQDANPYNLPEELQQFWRDYALAKEADDEPAMDKAVRRNHERAVRTLDLLIDDYSMSGSPTLPEELRTLAWCLGRVDGHQRYIERVRYVLELEPGGRRARIEGLNSLSGALDLFNKAVESKSADDYALAQAAFEPVLQRWFDLGDFEQAVFTLDLMAACEAGRGRSAERAALLRKLVEQAPRLPYKDEKIGMARLTLEELAASGADTGAGAGGATGAPDGADGGEAAPDEAAPPEPGAALKAFAAGAEPVVVVLADDKGSKGLAPVVLPGFAPIEQYLLWPQSFVDSAEEPNPDIFDPFRSVQLKPFGATMTVERESSRFKLDVDGDGEADITVTPNGTPQRFELPGPDGKSFYPLMLSIPGDREDMFGIAANYAPQKTTARLRFGIGGALQGEVLGSTWRLYDTNLSGRFGDDAAKYWDDGTTLYEESLTHTWYETDAVQIGKAKAAIPWSRAMPVGEDFYRVEIGDDGRTLTAQKLALETGLLQLDIDTAVAPTHVVLAGTGPLEGAFFNVVPAKKGGSVKLPAGSYTIASGRIESGKKTSMQQVRIYQGRSGSIEVKPGETTTLELGAPYTLRAKTGTSEDGLGFVQGTSLRIFGRAGEEYAMLFDDPLQPEVEVRGKGERKIVKGDAMQRANIEQWQNNTSGKDNVLWFPTDYAFEIESGEAFQVRLTQESHRLLGGPFDSDWTP
jgi:hypothetical protein